MLSKKKKKIEKNMVNKRFILKTKNYAIKAVNQLAP